MRAVDARRDVASSMAQFAHWFPVGPNGFSTTASLETCSGFGYLNPNRSIDPGAGFDEGSTRRDTTN